MKLSERVEKLEAVDRDELLIVFSDESVEEARERATPVIRWPVPRPKVER